MLTEKDFCDYDTCVALKELGCPLSSFEKWENRNEELELVPHFLLYSAQKWLREEKRIEVNAFFDRDAEMWYSYINFMNYPDLMGIEVMKSIYASYEEALSEGIKDAIKILKEDETL